MIDIKRDLTNFSKLSGVSLRLPTDREILSADEFYLRSYRHVLDYTPEQIDKIINGGSLAEKQALSRAYYQRNGLYKRIILYYATLLTYQGILIPHAKGKNQLSNDSIKKKYAKVLDFLNKIPTEEIFTRIAIKSLVDGTYYGIVIRLNEDEFALLDLPYEYCRSILRDTYGNDIVEFNVAYFDSITSLELRKRVLEGYPKEIRKAYKAYQSKGGEGWTVLDTAISVCFPFLEDGLPLFLSVIPATIQYDDAVDNERERELDEIRKIIVQKVPHLTDGQLLFEPIEAEEMHQGAVNMLKGNRNISVLTTYADVEAIISKTSSDNVNNSLEKMLQNVYSEAGASSQIFSATGTQAINISIKNDISLMMILGNQLTRFMTNVVNYVFSSTSVDFKYQILPISLYTKDEEIDNSLKMAQSGYSYLLPAIISGLKQRDFVSVKDLENDLLELGDRMIPLSSSFNQSSGNPVGAPEKKLEEKSDKTIQNENAIDNQGGSD